MRGSRADQRPIHVAHSHSHASSGPVSPAVAAVRRRATILLIVVLVPLVLATVGGVAHFWPHGASPQNRSLDTTYAAPGGAMLEGTVTSLSMFSCAGGGDLPDTAGHHEMTCVSARVRLQTGPQRGKLIKLELPPEINRAGVKVGDRLKVLDVPVGPDRTDYYAFVDFVRGVPMAVLAIVYAVVVVAVARMRGLRALIGLGLSYAMLAFFMLPALLRGESPLWVGLTGCAAIVFVVLYLAHGLSARTSTALLGTLTGLAITAGLAAWATGAAHLSGMTSDESFILLSSTKTLDLSQIVLCGIILAGLGILNDVTITQASAVWELYEVSPDAPAGRLFAGAMRIGRDHIASTVYTIAYAYAGAALPILLLISLYQRPFLTAVTSSDLAEEVVRTLVGSIGLVLAIPLTTLVAVAVVKAVGSASRTPPPWHS